MEFKLIIKKLNNTLSQSETEVFNGWYNEKTEHRSYFNNVKENYNDNIDNVDLEKGWHSIVAKIDAPKHRNTYWKYAVAASVILIVSLTAYLNTGSEIEIKEPIIVNTGISPGVDKATLTLGDGSQVELEEGGTFQTQNANSNGEEIIYKKENKKTKKLVYNILTIPRGGQYFIELSDGTQAWLNSESQLKYPVNFIEGKTRQVELVYGEAYFDVSPSTDHQGSKFKVLNKTQEVEVLGTEFNIKAYLDEEVVYTTLVEGKVAVNNATHREILLPNQQSKINIKNKVLTIEEVNVFSEVSWKDGLFSFKSKPLKEIMIVLSRWYDVEVEFANVEHEDVKFNGVLSKNDSMEEILTVIMNTKFINAYDINDKNIIIK